MKDRKLKKTKQFSAGPADSCLWKPPMITAFLDEHKLPYIPMSNSI